MWWEGCRRSQHATMCFKQEESDKDLVGGAGPGWPQNDQEALPSPGRLEGPEGSLDLPGHQCSPFPTRGCPTLCLQHTSLSA